LPEKGERKRTLSATLPRARAVYVVDLIENPRGARGVSSMDIAASAGLSDELFDLAWRQVLASASLAVTGAARPDCPKNGAWRLVAQPYKHWRISLDCSETARFMSRRRTDRARPL
jgi:hypothetical protein